MADLEKLTAGLRKTSGRAAGVEAAVELLIWHDYWIRRADFVKACVRTYEDRAVIRWGQAREFAAASPLCSTTQLNVLRFAVALGSDEFGLSKMGGAHASAIGRAMAIALGTAYPGAPFAPPHFGPGIDEERATRG